MQFVLDILIQLGQVHIGPELAGQVTNRQTA